jgi:phosphoenolpyruvate carboxylase
MMPRCNNTSNLGARAMESASPSKSPEKDAPLRYDIRLLGRILGETIRAQEWEEVFDTVERIRQTSVRFHRDAHEAARRELQGILAGLSTEQAITVIRGYGYFSASFEIRVGSGCRAGA